MTMEGTYHDAPCLECDRLRAELAKRDESLARTLTEWNRDRAELAAKEREVVHFRDTGERRDFENGQAIAALRKLCADESAAMRKQRDEHSCHSEECNECERVMDGAILRLDAAGRGEGTR